MIKTALILSAGRGERLRPLTDTLPKPLIEVNGKPLIVHHIDHLMRAGFERIVINHAWLGGKIRHAVLKEKFTKVTILFSPEPPGGLETGGGIINALPLLGDQPFLTVNADIYTDYAFSNLALPQHSLIHLVLVPTPPNKNRSDFGLSPDGHVINTPATHTAAGITCYHPEVFNVCKRASANHFALGLPSHQGRREEIRKELIGRYSITPLWRELADIGKITGEIFNGLWMDIGTTALPAVVPP